MTLTSRLSRKVSGVIYKAVTARLTVIQMPVREEASVNVTASAIKHNRCFHDN